jgi:hypothetical protein
MLLRATRAANQAPTPDRKGAAGEGRMRWPSLASSVAEMTNDAEWYGRHLLNRRISPQGGVVMQGKGTEVAKRSLAYPGVPPALPGWQ